MLNICYNIYFKSSSCMSPDKLFLFSVRRGLSTLTVEAIFNSCFFGNICSRSETTAIDVNF